MSAKQKKYIKIAYLLLLSLMLTVSAVLFILSCLDIYGMDKIAINGTLYLFTRERIGEAFSKIAIPVYFTAALALLGIPLEIFVFEDERIKSPADNSRALKLLLSKLDVNAASSESLKVIEREEKKRKMLNTVLFALLAAGSAGALVFALNGDNYSSTDINQSILTVLGLVLACLSPATVFAFINIYAANKSMDSEIKAVRKEIAGGAFLHSSENKSDVNKYSFFKKNEKKIKIVLTSVIAAVSVLFVILGIFNGGLDDVIAKAVKICQECIGMG